MLSIKSLLITPAEMSLPDEARCWQDVPAVEGLFYPFPITCLDSLISD